MTAHCSATFQAAYDAFTTGHGAIALSDWSVITLFGEDRARFLHNMCTNDILRLNNGEGCEAFCTDVKGKIVAHVIVLVLDKHVELLTAPGQAEKIIFHFERYVIREDVVIRNATDECCWVLFSGAKSKDFLETFASDNLAALEHPWQCVQTQFGDADGVVTRAGLIWPPSYLIRLPRRQGASLLPKEVVLSDDRTIWNTLRLESSFPLYGVDFDSAHLPQEVDRNEVAISFNKGCYLGQETVARIDALGHVNRRLCLVRLAGSEVPQPGLKLLAGDKEVGEVTSSCWSPRYQAPLALASIRRGSNTTGYELDSQQGKATIIPTEQET
ncbi:MAG: hypothetical protein MI725_02480 [Pirellulales bacterium]|nr:hypothetical protein [Pirellulales bacterium]